MNKNEHLLTTLAEECNEVAQRATKALRFSLTEIQPGQPYTNAERIMHEYADLEGMMEKLVGYGVLEYPADYEDRIEAKKLKFEKMLEISRRQGTLNE